MVLGPGGAERRNSSTPKPVASRRDLSRHDRYLSAPGVGADGPLTNDRVVLRY